MNTSGADIIGRLAAFAAAGGPVAAVLGMLSVVTLTVVIAKLFQLHRSRLDPDGAVATALTRHERGQTADALRHLRAARGSLAPLVTRALAGCRAGLPETRVREAVEHEASRFLEDLRSHVRLLEVVAAISPLLGLLGTVLGMIDAFQQMEAAGNQVDPALLAGGIWEALLTTASGLTVAIPAMAAFTWLERRIERTAHHIEDAVTRVYTAEVSHDATTHPADTADA